MLVDTNVIIDAVKGHGSPNFAEGYVSTVSLHELFGVYRGSGNDYRFYPKYPRASLGPVPDEMLARWYDKRHLEQRHPTDALTFSGGNGFDARQLFSHGTAGSLVDKFGAMALAHQATTVNPRRRASFRAAARLIDEMRQVPLPLTQAAVDDSEDIFATFAARHTSKRDHRNSMNDLLILAQARHAGLKPFTSDKLMLTIAGDVLGWNVIEPGSHRANADYQWLPDRSRGDDGRRLHTIWRQTRR